VTTHTVPPPATAGLRPAGDDRWAALRALVVVRLVVAALAVPVGVLWWPGAGSDARWIATATMIAVGVASALMAALARWRRSYGFQVGLQLGLDVVLITTLAAHTGGRGSQFVPFYVLVAITGGLLAGLRGGISASVAACAAYVALPWIASRAGIAGGADLVGLPQPALLVALLALVGALAGVLGSRAQEARADLARASRELDRVRFDHDVILRHLTSGVITIDALGHLAYVNPAAAEVLGIVAADVQGRAVADCLPGRLGPLRDALLAALERREMRLRGELLVRSGSGRSLPVGLSTNLLTHEGQVTGVVAVFTDLTEVREMEQRARRNQTLAEVGALAAGIAHELRNGLNPISGSVEYLQRELKLEGESAQLLDLIGTECVRLNRFVTDLLNYARERAIVKEPIDCAADFADVTEALRRDARCAAGVRIVLDGDPADAVLWADKEQLRQVWINLAINALEALGDRGTLTVRWRLVESAGMAVEFMDDGPGIPAEDLPRVGEPFFTTKRGGTGLGLAIAQRIVERHGGTLKIESAPGRGTTARVALPEAAAGMAAAA
jgi:two-component system sensor histidine kinase PilS (NtrC family)